MVDTVLPNEAILTQLEPVLAQFLLDQNYEEAEQSILNVVTSAFPGQITDTEDIMNRLATYQQQLTTIQNTGEELDLVNARIEELQYCLGLGD